MMGMMATKGHGNNLWYFHVTSHTMAANRRLGSIRWFTKIGGVATASCRQPISGDGKNAFRNRVSPLVRNIANGDGCRDIVATTVAPPSGRECVVGFAVGDIGSNWGITFPNGRGSGPAPDTDSAFRHFDAGHAVIMGKAPTTDPCRRDYVVSI